MRFLAALGLAVAFVAAQAEASHAGLRHMWSRMLDADGRVSFPVLDGVNFPAQRQLLATDDNGDLFVVVEARNHVSFGGAQSGPGLVAARLDENGNELWSRALPNALVTIAAARNGSLVIAGGYSGTVDFGGGPMTSVLSSYDAFVVMLDAAGSVLWQRSFGDKWEQIATSAAVAPNGDIIVTGYNYGVIDFGGGAIRTNGSYDAFLARLSGSNGGHVWSRGYGQSGDQKGRQVAVGSDGRIALTCDLVGGGIDMGGGLINAYPGGAGDIVVAVLDENASHVWSRRVGSPAFETTQDLAVDGAGNVYLCGLFQRSMDTGGDLLVGEQTAQFTGFAVSYGQAGEFRWSYAVKDSLKSMGARVAIDGEGNCVLLATKQKSLDVAGTSLDPAAFFLINFDGAGRPTSARAFGQWDPFPNTRMVTRGDRIYLGGAVSDRIDLGGGDLLPASGTGVFLARLDTRRPPRVTISHLSARADGADVEVRWNIASGEALSNYYLTRSIDGSSQAQVIDSAPAKDGDVTFIDHEAHPGHRHIYELTVETALGDPVSNSVSIQVPALQTNLGQNTPNPFNPLTTFPYALAAPAHVSIAIYDMTGALVARLDQGTQPAGRHEAKWGGHNWEGSVVASGVYFYRLEGAGDVGTRKMVLLK